MSKLDLNLQLILAGIGKFVNLLCFIIGNFAVIF